MIAVAVPIALVLFGYWAMYAGVKGVSMVDAYRCAPQQQQTPGDQSGQVVFGPGGPVIGTISKDCKPQAGDTILPPLPWDKGKHLIWRVGPRGGVWGQVTGSLVGPC